jgi:hypothetical protein
MFNIFNYFSDKVFAKMTEILQKYIPHPAIEPIIDLIKSNQVHLKIVNERKTRHGDYRKNPDGRHQITVNVSLNQYRFLMTLVHEIAHLAAFEKFGRNIKPHGIEWKMTFQRLMIPFLRPDIYPNNLLPLLARHFKNPSASSDTDATLALALKQFDAPNDKNYVFEIPYNTVFKIANGKVFKKIALRTKRYECLEIGTGKLYLFNPNAEVWVD